MDKYQKSLMMRGVKANQRPLLDEEMNGSSPQNSWVSGPQNSYSPDENQEPSQEAATHLAGSPPIPTQDYAQGSGPRLNIGSYQAPTPSNGTMPFNAGLPQVNRSADPEQRFTNLLENQFNLARGVNSEDVFKDKLTPGMSKNSLDKLNLDYKGVRTTPTFIDKAKKDEALDYFRNQPEYKAVKDNQSLTRDLLRAGIETSPSRPDLSVLGDFVKNISGGRVTAEGYKPPHPAMSVRDAIGILQNSGKVDESLLKDAYAALKAQEGGTLLESAALQIGKQSGDKNAPFRPPVGKGPYDPTKDVQKLQKSLQDIEPLVSGFDAVEKSFAQSIGKKSLSEWKGEDIPGVGATGRLPEIMLGNSGKNNKQLYMNLKNSVVYAMSGKQINEAEGKRLNAALGDSFFGTDKAAIMGLANFKRALKNIMQQREAQIAGVPGKGKVVLDAYKSGGGTLHSDIPDPDYGGLETTKPTGVSGQPDTTLQKMQEIQNQNAELMKKLNAQ